MSTLIDKINQTLVKLGSNIVLADVTPAETIILAASGETASGETSGSTSGVTITSAAAGVVVSEIIPKTIKISYSAIGAPVIQTNEDCKEENVTDGEYILTTNKKITVQDGKLISEIEVEELTEEQMSGTTELSKEEIELAAVKAIADQQIEVQMASVRSIITNIDFTKAGSYYISIDINAEGEVTYATASINTYQNLLMEKEAEIEVKVTELTSAFEAKLSAQEAVIEALKTGETKIKNAPEASDVKLSKSDYIKLDIQEKIKNNK